MGIRCKETTVGGYGRVIVQLVGARSRAGEGGVVKGQEL